MQERLPFCPEWPRKFGTDFRLKEEKLMSTTNNHPDYAALRPLDLSLLKTYDLDSRPSKVFHDDLGRPLRRDASAADFLMSLPRQLAANDVRRVADHLVRAKQEGRTV